MTKLEDEITDQSRREYLEKLIKDFERDQTIHDVGRWLVHDSPDPLPPKHIAVLREWLETHNKLTIKQNRRGNPHGKVRNAFIYVTRMHRDTGMSIEAACNLVVEKLNLKIDSANFRRMYDRAQTPETRMLNEIVAAIGAFSKGSTPKSKVTKSLHRFKKSMKDREKD